MSDEVEKQLRRLAASLAGRTDFELSNLASDLGAVVQRLDSGEYREADFLVRNVFDVQRRTREYLTYFAGWNAQAHDWAALLDSVGARTASEVIDLCPGWAPKIELALLKLGFTGRVRLLDKNAETAAMLVRFIDMLAPGFQLEAVAADLFDPPTRSAGLVVANHLLDDLVLDRWAARLGVDRARLYDDETALATAWRRLLERRDEVMRELPPAAAAAMAAHVAPGGTLVITHYPSHAERLLGAASTSQFFDALFAATCDALGALGLARRALDFPRGQAAAFTRAG